MLRGGFGVRVVKVSGCGYVYAVYPGLGVVPLFM